MIRLAIQSRPILALAILACMAQLAAAADTADLLETACARFREASDLGLEDQATARNLHADAAKLFQEAIDSGSIDKGRAYYNLATAHYHAGDIGRAILNYRRAEAFMPTNVTLRSNLETARRRRVDYVEQTPERHAFATLLFWHYDLSPTVRAELFVLCYLILWACAFARLFFDHEEIRWGLGLSAVGSVVLAISLGVGSGTTGDPASAVVVAAQTMPYSEPSLASKPALATPLHSGAELRITGERDGWYRIVLADGRSGWTPQEGLVRIFDEG